MQLCLSKEQILKLDIFNGVNREGSKLCLIKRLVTNLRLGYQMRSPRNKGHQIKGQNKNKMLQTIKTSHKMGFNLSLS